LGSQEAFKTQCDQHSKLAGQFLAAKLQAQIPRADTQNNKTQGMQKKLLQAVVIGMRLSGAFDLPDFQIIC
jgi:hypothetical protein